MSMSLCLFPHISRKLHGPTSPSFVYVACVGGYVLLLWHCDMLGYVLPVFWMTLCFHTIGSMVRSYVHVHVMYVYF